MLEQVFFINYVNKLEIILKLKTFIFSKYFPNLAYSLHAQWTNPSFKEAGQETVEVKPKQQISLK